jgi:hypothetical protein
MNFRNTSTQSSLTASDVLDIRRLHDNEGFNDAHLGRIFNVSRKAIYNIVNRKTWTQVPNPVSVRGYGNYSVYPDGRVLSKATGEFLSTIHRTSGPAVRLRKANGSRTTVAIESLLRTGFKA